MEELLLVVVMVELCSLFFSFGWDRSVAGKIKPAIFRIPSKSLAQKTQK